MSNENQQVSQADKLMERWAGRKADKSRIVGGKPTVSGYTVRMRLHTASLSSLTPSMPLVVLACL